MCVCVCVCVSFFFSLLIIILPYSAIPNSKKSPRSERPLFCIAQETTVFKKKGNKKKRGGGGERFCFKSPYPLSNEF